MNEFLNPKSMSTPGAAGALMMLIANALCNNFPEFPFRYVALILSFAIGAVVFAASTMKVWERGIYWVVNSLIIFSMGVGATNIAANVAAQQASNEHSTSVAAAILSAFAGTAFAQDGKASLPPASVPKNQAPVTTAASQPKPSSEAALRARIKELESRISVLKADKESSLSEVIELRRKANAAATPPSNEIAGKSAPEGFFKRW